MRWWMVILIMLAGMGVGAGICLLWVGRSLKKGMNW